MASSFRRSRAGPPALRQSLGGGLLPLVGDHHQPVAAHDHGPLERHDLLAADVRRRDVVAQDEPPAAKSGVEDAPGHDAVGRVGAGDLADRADVEAAGTAAHRLGDQAHARPGDPHEVPVQGVDGAACVAARRRQGGDPGGAVVREQRLPGLVEGSLHVVRGHGARRPSRRRHVLGQARQQRAEHDEDDHGDGEDDACAEEGGVSSA